MNPSPCRLLAISGSLRAQSINTAVLRAAAQLAPPGIEVVPYSGLALLPHFNPDLDTGEPPAAVGDFRREIDRAAGLLICTPEYAHGVPGSLKNAFDWLVSYEGFIGKPIALINARPRSSLAITSLRETLVTMNARLVEAASVTLPLDNYRLDADALAKIPEISALLRRAVAAMANAGT